MIRDGCVTVRSVTSLQAFSRARRQKLLTYYYCFHSCASHSFPTLRRFEMSDKKTTSLCNRALPPSAQLFGTHFKTNILKIICLTFAGLRLNLMSLFFFYLLGFVYFISFCIDSKFEIVRHNPKLHLFAWLSSATNMV